MARNVLVFSKGLDEESANIAKDPERCDDIQNYEIIKDGQLCKRIDPTTFDAELNNLLAAVFNLSGNGKIVKIADEPFYPSNLPNDIAPGFDYLLPVYGFNGTQNLLHLFYKSTSGWTYGYNLTTNGNFATADNWNAAPGWTFTAGTGFVHADGGGTGVLSQRLELSHLTSYTVIFQMTHETGSVVVNLGTQPSQTFNTAGLHIVSVTADTSTGNSNIEFEPSNEFAGAIEFVVVLRRGGFTQGLYDSGIVYTSESNLRFFNGSTRLNIADGVNNMHGISINDEGTVIASTLGIPSPEYFGEFNPPTGFDSDFFDEVAENDHFDLLGLFQYVYTCSTSEGDETDPSFISDTLDMQWFMTTAEGANGRWVSRIQIDGLRIPDGVSEDIRDQLDFFNVYVRRLPGSADSFATTFNFVERVRINNKFDTNSYIIDAPTRGDAVSYENGVAPIASDVCEINNVVVGANLKRLSPFPTPSDGSVAITLDNSNIEGFVNGVFRIRIYGSTSDDPTAISGFNPTHNLGTLGEEQDYRFYGIDGYTPLKSIVADWHFEAGESDVVWMDFLVEVPAMPPSIPHTIYFVFVNDVTTLPEAFESKYLTFEFGKTFIKGQDADANRIMFTRPPYMERTEQIVFSPALFNKAVNEFYNRADARFDGTGDDTTFETGTGPFFNVDMGIDIGTSFYKFSETNNAQIDYGEASPGSEDEVSSAYGWIKFDPTADSTEYISGGDFNIRTICGNFHVNTSNEPRGWLLGLIKDGSVIRFATIVGADNTASPPHLIGANMNGMTETRLFYWISVDIANNRRYFFACTEDGIVIANDFTDEFIPDTIDYDFSANSNILNGNTDNYAYSGVDYLTSSIPGAEFAGFGFINNHFSNSFNECFLRANLMAQCSTPIGIEYENNYTGNDLTFAAGTKIISRSTSTGDSLEDVLGDDITHIRVYGSGANDGIYEVTDITDNNITVAEALTTATLSTIASIVSVRINRNILFGETEDTRERAQANGIVWSQPYGFAFPDLYTKLALGPVLRIIPVPSFLQFQHGKVVLIARRNGWELFNIEGTPDSWANADLIPEIKDFGLLNSNCLQVTGSAVVYLSERGFMRWDARGLRPVSENVLNILNYVRDINNG